MAWRVSLFGFVVHIYVVSSASSRAPKASMLHRSLRSSRRLLSSAFAREPIRLPRVEALGWHATPTGDALGAEIEGADLSQIGDVEVSPGKHTRQRCLHAA